MTDAPQPTVHGTAVALRTGWRWRAVLLRGASGSGKSDLALRLTGAGGRLIADDRVVLTASHGTVVAGSAVALQGLLEVRGLGILRMKHRPFAPLSLIVDLVPRDAVPRLPEMENEILYGCSITRIKLHAFDISTPDKIRLALAVVNDPQMVIR